MAQVLEVVLGDIGTLPLPYQSCIFGSAVTLWLALLHLLLSCLVQFCDLWLVLLEMLFSCSSAALFCY